MFSVVITTKNRIDFLCRAVCSISKSSVMPIDIVIINDGGDIISTDLFELPNVNFTIVNHDSSKGANYCRNVGIELANEDIVFLLDDDDALTEISFVNRLKAFKDPEVGISFTGIQVVSDMDLLTVQREVIPSQRSSYFPELFKYGNLIGSTSRVAIRKTWFQKAGKFDENLACLQDYDLWIRMARISKVVTDSKANVYYTIHSQGKQVSSNYQKYIIASDYLLNKYSKELDSTSCLREFRSQLFLRIALASASTSIPVKLKYSFMSFINKPSFKAIVLFTVPVFWLKKLFNFV